MPTANETERTTDAEKTAPSREEVSSRRAPGKLRVYMMDMWSFIPYYMAGLCAALATEDVEVKLGSVRYHLDRDYFRKAGLAPDRLLIDAGGNIATSAVRRLAKSCEYVANLVTLGLRFSCFKPDIVHVQYLPFLERGFRFELWFLAWVRRLGIRIVYTVHNVTRQDAPEEGRPLFQRAYRLADALICHGEAARTELERDFQIAADKIWLIPHGPLFDDGPRLTPQEARSRLGLQQKEPLVLCQGVISEYKGIPFLLDAWKQLKAAGVAGRLLIAGTGDQRILSEIQETVVAEALSDSVSLWLHFIPVEQLPFLYQAADVLVYPYKAGTTSGALLTGLNYGKAVVATRLPFFLEQLKDGETALLVDYGATDALAGALQTLIQQPQRCAELAGAIKREASKGIGWQEISWKTKRCYQAVLAV
jgi:glycosyltransferase involved in cell wall biosynthesis